MSSSRKGKHKPHTEKYERKGNTRYRRPSRNTTSAAAETEENGEKTKPKPETEKKSCPTKPKQEWPKDDPNKKKKPEMCAWFPPVKMLHKLQAEDNMQEIPMPMQ